MDTRYVIVGGVAAGATAAARLRRLDEKADILIVERGRYVSYANCGLPYFIGGEIQKRSHLLLQTPEGFYSRYRVKVELETEAVAIDRQNHTLRVRGPGGQKDIPWDKLILAQGGSPFVPPLPGVDLDHVFKLWTVPDMDSIHKYIKEHSVTKAVIAGAGFIGLEMAEAFVHRGIDTTVVELAPRVLPLLDNETAQAAREVLESHGVKVRTGVALKEIHPDQVLLSDGQTLEAGLVLMSVGVRPNLDLAKSAGLKIGPAGGLELDQYLHTSDPDILAAGDMVEVVHRVGGHKVRIPLAGPANRQGRLAADNALGRQVAYHGALGTSVVKLFDHTAASCGLGLEAAGKLGIDARMVTIHKDNHASYYPGGSELSLSLVFDSQGRILGAQAIGQAGVEKRIDVLATAMVGGMDINGLAELDLAYAPPYSSANDPVNVVAFVAQNSLNGHSPSIDAQGFLDQWDPREEVLLDVRTLGEYSRRHLKGSRHIPLDELRDRLEELPRDKAIAIHCASGYRSHLALRILAQEGFTQVRNISGGMTSLARCQPAMAGSTLEA